MIEHREYFFELMFVHVLHSEMLCHANAGQAMVLFRDMEGTLFLNLDESL